MAGFTLQSLRSEQSRLRSQQAQLNLEEARLLNPDRLEKLAKSLQMIDPDPTQVEMLEGSKVVVASLTANVAR